MSVEELAGLGKVTKEIEPLKGFKIKIHSLTVAEEEEIYKALSKLPDDPLVRTSNLQIETLSRAIESINNVAFYEVNELKNHLRKLQRHVLSTLWEAFIKEVEENSLKEIGDLKKNSEQPTRD